MPAPVRHSDSRPRQLIRAGAADAFARPGARSDQREGASWQDASIFVFDVEGTLVDSVLCTLRCWQATLEEFGHEFELAELHPFSGMEAGEMLDKLIPGIGTSEKRRITEVQGRRYRADYLPFVQSLPGARRLLERLKQLNRRIALATDCSKDELKHYLGLAKVDGLVDAVACGDDARRGKPHPDLICLALQRLRAQPGKAVMIGDTPYDAKAAHALGLSSIGLLSGLFSVRQLEAAGCIAVFRDVAALRGGLKQDTLQAVRAAPTLVP